MSASTSQETIVAVYDTPSAADAAVADLRAARVPESAISRHSGSAASGMAGTGTTTTGMTGTTTGSTEGKGFWAGLFGGDDTTNNDSMVYDRSMQSGSSVVVVKGIPGHDVDSVIAILDKHSPIDIDERAAGYGTTSGATTGMATGTMAATTTTATTGTAGYVAPRTGLAGDAGKMQLSEEQLAVGKRVVNRGGTRIRRYVVETPVQESVTLHEERVTLERNPVTDGRPIADGSFSEKTIEMTETAEEAVVSKTARVVEEVGLRKEATDRVETIRDTVRKEAVEIEQVPGQATTSTTTTTGTPVRPTTPKI